MWDLALYFFFVFLQTGVALEIGETQDRFLRLGPGHGKNNNSVFSLQKIHMLHGVALGILLGSVQLPAFYVVSSILERCTKITAGW